MHISTSIDQVQEAHKIGAQVLSLFEKAFTAAVGADKSAKNQQAAIEAAYLILREHDVNTVKSVRFFVAAEFEDGKLDNKSTKLFAVLTGNIVKDGVLSPIDFDEFYGKEGLLKAYNAATMSTLEKNKVRYLAVLDKRTDQFQETFWSVTLPKLLGFSLGEGEVAAALDAHIADSADQVEEAATV